MENMKKLGYSEKNRMEGRLNEVTSKGVSDKATKSAFSRFFDRFFGVCKKSIVAVFLVFYLTSGVAYPKGNVGNISSGQSQSTTSGPTTKLPRLDGVFTREEVENKVMNVLQNLIMKKPLIGVKDFPYTLLNKLINGLNSLRGDLVIKVDMKTGKVIYADLKLDDKITNYEASGIAVTEQYLQERNKEIRARLAKLKAEGCNECFEAISLTKELLDNNRRLAEIAGEKSNLGHILKKDERTRLEKAICDVIKKNVGFIAYGTNEIIEVPIDIELKIE